MQDKLLLVKTMSKRGLKKLLGSLNYALGWCGTLLGQFKAIKRESLLSILTGFIASIDLKLQNVYQPSVVNFQVLPNYSFVCK